MSFTNEEVMRATELALRQYSQVTVTAYSFATHTISNYDVKLYTSDKILRTYGYIAFDGTNWVNRLKRHFNSSTITVEMLTDASGYDLLGPAPTLLLEYTLT